jgi:hypothetical protein
MASTASAVAPAASAGHDAEVSLLRLYLLRANYLLWAVAGLFVALPPLIDPDPMARGMIDSMFGGL